MNQIVIDLLWERMRRELARARATEHPCRECGDPVPAQMTSCLACAMGAGTSDEEGAPRCTSTSTS